MTGTNVRLTDDLMKQVAQRVNELIVERSDAEKLIGIESYIPHEKFKKVIAEIFEKRRKVRSTRTLRTVIVIAAVLAMLFVCALSVSAVRQAISKFIFSINDGHAVVHISNEDNVGAESDFEKICVIETYYEPSYIPEGLEMIEHVKYYTKQVICYESDDKFLIYHQELMPDSIQIDCDDGILNVIDINSTIGYYSKSESITVVVWYNDVYVYKITSDLDFDTIIKIAESIK